MSFGSPSTGDDLPAEWSEAFKSLPSVVESDVHQRRPEIAEVLSWSARVERMKTLQPRLLVIDAEHPFESPDLLQVQELYNKNLISNEAFLALEQDDHLTFTLASDRGGMLNHFQPTDAELAHYGSDYETVRDQIVKDLLGDPDRPGDYRMMGLFDTNGILRASLSYRLPPKMPATSDGADEYMRRMGIYKKYLSDLLLDPKLLTRNQQMKYEIRWDKKKLEEQFADLWEIDTFNVDPEWRGAGYLVLQKAIDQIKSERGEIPDAVFCYRFSGIRSRDRETKQYVRVGPNRGSRTFLENIGFHDMAHKAVRSEVVVREMSDGHCHQYNPEWLFLHNGRNRLQRQLAQHLQQMGLLGS